MSVDRRTFQDLTERVLAEFDEMDTIRYEVPPAGLESEESLAALGAFRGSVNIASAAKDILCGAVDDYRLSCAGIALVRPATEWYLRGVWLWRIEGLGDKAQFLIPGRKGRLSRDALPEIDALASHAQAAMGNQFGYFDRLSDVKQDLNSHIHGDLDAMLGATSEEMAEKWHGYELLGKSSVLLCLTAFRAITEILEMTKSDIDPWVLSQRAGAFAQTADELLGEHRADGHRGGRERDGDDPDR